MTAEWLARPKRRLEIDGVAWDELGERGAAKCLGHGVERERAVFGRDDGEADAAHRDGVAERGACCGRGSADDEAHTRRVAGDGFDPSALAQVSGEHGRIVTVWAQPVNGHGTNSAVALPPSGAPPHPLGRWGVVGGYTRVWLEDVFGRLVPEC